MNIILWPLMCLFQEAYCLMWIVQNSNQQNLPKWDLWSHGSFDSEINSQNYHNENVAQGWCLWVSGWVVSFQVNYPKLSEGKTSMCPNVVKRDSFLSKFSWIYRTSQSIKLGFRTAWSRQKKRKDWSFAMCFRDVGMVPMGFEWYSLKIGLPSPSPYCIDICIGNTITQWDELHVIRAGK